MSENVHFFAPKAVDRFVTAHLHQPGGNEPVEEKLGDQVHEWPAVPASVGKQAVLGGPIDVFNQTQ